MKVIILAAGLGSRLGELGKNIPKGMITIFGKTLIERQIEIFHNCGINDITIITGHNSEVIKYTNVDLNNIIFISDTQPDINHPNIIYYEDNIVKNVNQNL